MKGIICINKSIRSVAVKILAVFCITLCSGSSVNAENNVSKVVAAQVLAQEGTTLAQAGNNKEAIEKLKKSLDYQPDIPEVMGNYALALMNDGQYEDALAEFNRTIELKPSLATTWLNIGDCHASLGHFQEALDAWNKFLQLNPNGSENGKVRQQITNLQTQLKGEQDQSRSDSNDYLAEAIKYIAVRWPANSMPLRVYIKLGQSVPQYRQSYERILKQSLIDWARAAKGLVTFVFTTDPNQANISCAWVADANRPTNSTEEGLTIPAFNGHDITRVDIQLYTTDLNHLPLSDNCAYRTDLHEIGHALGLADHSHNADDIMFCMETNKEAKLSERDKNTLIALYTIDKSQLSARATDDTHLIQAGTGQDSQTKAIDLNNQASTALEHKDFPLALSKMEEAYHLDPTVNHKQNLGIVYGRCASAFRELNKSAEAEDCYKKGLAISSDCPDQSIYKEILADYQDFQKNKSQLNTQAELNRSDRATKAIQLNNQASTVMEQENYSLALSKMEEAYKLDPSVKHKQNLGITYGRCAGALWESNNLVQANEYYKKGLALLSDCPDQSIYKGLLAQYQDFQKDQSAAKSSSGGN